MWPLVSDFFHLIFSSFINASFCLWLNNIPLYELQHILHYSFIMMLVALWIFAQCCIDYSCGLKLLCGHICFSILLDIYLRVELMRSGNSVLLLRNWQTVFQSCSTIFRIPPTVYEGFHWSNCSCNTCYCLSFWW